MLPRDTTTLGAALLALSYDKSAEAERAGQAYMDATCGRGTLTSLDSQVTFPVIGSPIIKRGQKYRYDYGQVGDPQHYSFEFVP